MALYPWLESFAPNLYLEWHIMDLIEVAFEPPYRFHVTEQAPPREFDRLDWERCAELHNAIITRGWKDSERNLSELNALTTWWDDFGEHEITQSGRLNEALLKFLSRALTPQEPRWNFFRFLGWLPGPDLMFDRALFDDEGGKDRYVLLYYTNGAVETGHKEGVIYDQLENLAIFKPTMEDWAVSDGRTQWQPLEVLLDSWLDMIDEGKVVASAREPERDGDHTGAQQWLEPWSMPPFTKLDLEASLSAFEELVESIEARMPPESLTSETIEYGFITREDKMANTARANGFARQFLSAARRPRFKFIAPGLEFNPTTAPQPFDQEAPVKYCEDVGRPVLLARGPANAFEDRRDSSSRGPDYIMSDVSFRACFPKLPTFPSGLYLTEWDPYYNLPFEVSLNRQRAGTIYHGPVVFVSRLSIVTIC